MKSDVGLSQRLGRAFLIQAGLISLTVILGVYAARFVIGDILLQKALEDEAAHYWSMYDNDASTPRPNTYNLTGYLHPDDESIPAGFLSLSAGYHKVSGGDVDIYIVHVSTHRGETLYLEFDGQQVSELALFFGVVPLVGFLIVIYLSGWIAYRFSSQAISPIVRLANIVEHMDPRSEAFAEKLKQSMPENVDQEVAVLSEALSGLTQRIESLVMRERNFTRDVSHELRSPITVIKIAVDFLLEDQGLDDTQRRPLARIKRNATDMEELIEALLILARESETGLSLDQVCINDLVREEIDRTRSLLADKAVAVDIEDRQQLSVMASDKVLSVMIGNLIRNAFSYTDEGTVRVTILDKSLIIEDSGIGMPDNEVENMFKPFKRGAGKQRGGYGVGLTIVKMLSDRFHWPIEIVSQLGSGTRVTVHFPEGKQQP